MSDEATRARRSPLLRVATSERAIGQTGDLVDTGETTGALNDARPTKRGGCVDEPRPCPFVSCRHHLYLDVNPETGSIKLNFPELEVWEMAESCALDVADRGGVTLEEVGQFLNLTRERIRQVEVRGLIRLKARGAD